MNNDRYIGTGQILVGLLVAALVLIACATVPQEVPETYEDRSDAESVSREGQVEEIVVTGARAERRYAASAGANSAPALSIESPARDAVPVPRASAVEEELWIIARPTAVEDLDNEDVSPGSGAMVAHFPADEEAVTPREIPLPLKRTAVEAVIDGYISSVDVTQQFHNPFSEKIEAVYLFPLPEKSAVSEFVMTIGERRIRGILREKQEAEAIYAEARSQGLQASLLVQHRPNIFEQKVANIEPGKAIDVNVRYFHTLAYNDGWYSFVFPTVVGPRYNPPGSADPIVPVPRGTHGEPETSIQYLRPDERSAHDLSINVRINAGVDIEAVRSTHEIKTLDDSAESKFIELANRSTIPNRDFVLDFQVAGDMIKSNLVTWTNPDTQQGYFTLMMYPPAEIESLERRPMEMVFVLDASGSMSGTPIEQAKGCYPDCAEPSRRSGTRSRSSGSPTMPAPSARRRSRQRVPTCSERGATSTA